MHNVFFEKITTKFALSKSSKLLNTIMSMNRTSTFKLMSPDFDEDDDLEIEDDNFDIDEDDDFNDDDDDHAYIEEEDFDDFDDFDDDDDDDDEDFY